MLKKKITMTDEEKIIKLHNAQVDIQNGKNILNSFSRYKIGIADEFVNKCISNPDYITFILANKIKDNLSGNYTFKQLNFFKQRQVLNMIIKSIEDYVAYLGIEDIVKTDSN
jgi:hypothetical protein